MIIRNAKNSDREKLRELFKECFGDLAEDGGALSWIEGRYKVAEDTNTNKIVAVSGILSLEHSDYNGYEITWTCTMPEYRKQGLIVEILKQCELELANDHVPLYCDCWRIATNEHINLYSVMKHLGMKQVIKNRVSRLYPHNKECVGCINKKEKCYCHGDLYMKER